MSEPYALAPTPLPVGQRGLQRRLFFGILQAAMGKQLMNPKELSVAENKAIVLNSIDRVWNRREVSAIDEMIVPNHLQQASIVPPGREGVKAFSRWWTAQLRNAP